MFELKPDFEDVLKRYEAWWDCAIVDRPLVSITFPKPQADAAPFPRKNHASIRDRWMDTEYMVKTAEAGLRNTVHFADSLPVAWPNLGPEVFSAFYGCEMEYGKDTAWSHPILPDWSEESLGKLRLDTNNFYFRKIMEMTDALIEAGRGKFIVGYTDLHGGGDAIAAFREPQELLLDTLEHPMEIKHLCDRITTDFLRVYDLFHEKLAAAGMPSTSWLPATGKGKYHIPSNDFSCMISDQSFEDLFLPGLIRECRHMTDAFTIWMDRAPCASWTGCSKSLKSTRSSGFRGRGGITGPTGSRSTNAFKAGGRPCKFLACPPRSFPNFLNHCIPRVCGLVRFPALPIGRKPRPRSR